jgi:hypothetical protein
MSDWKTINRHRIREGFFANTEADEFNGTAMIPINGLPVKIIFSDGMGWQHVSVSLANSTFTPSWEIMCKVKKLFWDDDQWVVQFHPAKSEYVNNHPGCLHLFRPTDGVFPVPPAILVGIKTEENKP